MVIMDAAIFYAKVIEKGNRKNVWEFYIFLVDRMICLYHSINMLGKQQNLYFPDIEILQEMQEIAKREKRGLGFIITEKLKKLKELETRLETEREETRDG